MRISEVPWPAPRTTMLLRLIVSPVQQVVPDEAFDKAADEVFERYDDMLRRLA